MAHAPLATWLQDNDADERPLSDAPYIEATDLHTPGPPPPSPPPPSPPPLPPLAPLESKPPPPPEKIVFLDGLRGLSAIFVVMTHAGYGASTNFKPGVPAVDFFFVLSAFLLTLLLEKTVRQLVVTHAPLRAWLVQLSIYFVRRFLRVYPLFALVAVAMALAPRATQAHYLFLPGSDSYKLLDVLTFRAHSHYFILWSLPVEIEYYFCIPVFVAVWILLGRLWPLLLAPALALVVYCGVYLGETRGDRQDGPLYPHLPTLLCGSLGAAVYGRLTAWITSQRFVFRVWHTLALRTLQLSMLALLVSDLLHGLVYDWFLTNPAPQTSEGVCFVSLHVTILIVCELLQPGGFVSAILEWGVLVYAGKVSFSMYLLHTFVVYSPTLQRQQPFYYNQVVLLWLGVFGISTLSYYLVEWPCQRLSARIAKWLKRFDEPSAGVAPEAAKMRTGSMQIV